jgi:uncharacterized glyoxalase superfamily protein PhnB
MTVRPALIVNLSYDDAPAAIEFLCNAFGFTRHAVYASEDGSSIQHAELTFDGNMIMLNSSRANPYGMATPKETGGLVTCALCLVLDDPDAHYATAAAAGADIINPPRDQDYGGRSYEARDPEGNVWCFGSYDPWASS